MVPVTTVPSTELEEIPLLDFSAFFHTGQASDRTQLCQALVGSLKQHGLVKLKNHAVDPHAIADAFGMSRRFFCLEEEHKRKAAHPNGPNPHRGYCHVGLEKTYGVTGFERGLDNAPRVLDIKESFDIGECHDSVFANRWPDDECLPGFRKQMEHFFDDCHNSLCNIMDAVAIGLGLEPRSLASNHSEKNHELRLLHYPAVDASLLDGSHLRIAEHTDFGTLTLLFQDEVGGLEVESQHYARTSGFATSGPLSFREVQESAPVMIVNIGDSLERWTNSYLRAVVHRMSKTTAHNLETAGMLKDRYSIAFFGKPNRNLSLLPLPPFLSDGKEPHWREITAHEYNQSKLVRTFAQ